MKYIIIILLSLQLFSCDEPTQYKDTEYSKLEMNTLLTNYITSNEGVEFIELTEKLKIIQDSIFIVEADTITEQLCFFEAFDVPMNSLFFYHSDLGQLFQKYTLYAFDSKDINQLEKGIEDKTVVNLGFWDTQDSSAWSEQKAAMANFVNCNYLFIAKLSNGMASEVIAGDYFAGGEVVGRLEVYNLRTLKLINILPFSVGNSFQVQIKERHNSINDATFDNLISNFNKKIGTLLFNSYTIHKMAPYLKYEKRM